MNNRKLPGILLSWFLKLAAVFLVVTIMLVLPLRWFDPLVSSFMVQHLAADWIEGEDEVFLYHQWVPWEEISMHVPRAVVAAEDQRFPDHFGFDLVEIGNAVKRYQRTGRLLVASTISQHLAKNLFLWPNQNLLLNGLESLFTLLIDLSLPKRRIL